MVEKNGESTPRVVSRKRFVARTLLKWEEPTRSLLLTLQKLGVHPKLTVVPP